MSVIWMSVSELKDKSFIDENVNDKLIRASIKEAQEIYIRDLIGSGLYNELQTQTANNAATLTALNRTLLNDYIRPCLMWYALVEGAYPLSIKIMGKGYQKRRSEFTDPATSEDVIADSNWARNKAEYYAQRVTKYLAENSSDYPLYLNPGSGLDTIWPQNTNFHGGFYFPDSPCDDPNYFYEARAPRED